MFLLLLTKLCCWYIFVQFVCSYLLLVHNYLFSLCVLIAVTYLLLMLGIRFYTAGKENCFRQVKFVVAKKNVVAVKIHRRVAAQSVRHD